VRIVLDTNVVLSALLWLGTPHQLLAGICQRKSIQLYSSTALLEELFDGASATVDASIDASYLITSGSDPEVSPRFHARVPIEQRSIGFSQAIKDLCERSARHGRTSASRPRHNGGIEAAL